MLLQKFGEKYGAFVRLHNSDFFEYMMITNVGEMGFKTVEQYYKNYMGTLSVDRWISNTKRK